MRPTRAKALRLAVSAVLDPTKEEWEEIDERVEEIRRRR